METASKYTKDEIEGFLSKLGDALTYGMVLRIKGFARGTDQTWYEVNCTPGTTVIQPRSVKRGILVVIGQNLKEEEIKRLFA